MAYSSETEVQYLINTSVGASDISAMITIADAELDLMLNGSSMSSNAKKGCSMRITALMLAQRDPELRTLGSVNMSFQSRLTAWQKYVDARVREAKIQTLRA